LICLSKALKKPPLLSSHSLYLSLPCHHFPPPPSRSKFSDSFGSISESGWCTEPSLRHEGIKHPHLHPQSRTCPATQQSSSGPLTQLSTGWVLLRRAASEGALPASDPVPAGSGHRALHQVTSQLWRQH